MTVRTEPQAAYTAFFSYRSPFRPAAKRLRDDLHAIAKRHPGHGVLDVFLDCSSLQPGPLTEQLRADVRRSRHLVVLLDRTTADSRHVADEISHWLDTTGSPDRLVLVKVDPSLALHWDPEERRLNPPEAVPEPVRDLFDAEPKWIDFSARGRLRRQEDDLPGLCAELMGVGARDFALVEASYQRRRARIRNAVSSVLAVLLVLAIVMTIIAVRNQRQAQQSANLALAQADSAEALLTVDRAPTVAIERVLRAAARSDSPTVRSAMLAVSQAAGRLTRAFTYPETDTGHPPTGARFSEDGSVLAVWGADRAPGTSRVQLWDVATGATVASRSVTVGKLGGVALLNGRFLVACAAAGSVLLDTASGATSVLLPSGPEHRCQLHEFGAGVIVSATDQSSGGSAQVITPDGAVTRADGLGSVASDPRSSSAVLAGPAGVVLVAGGRLVPVSSRPGGTAVFADASGNFLVRWSGEEWGVLTQVGGAPVLRTVTVPPIATDVTPMLNSDQMTGQLAWIADDGTIGWTGDGRRTKVDDAMGTSGSTPSRTRLLALGYNEALALFRNTATVVRVPGTFSERQGDGSPAVPSPDWTSTLVKQTVGSAPQAAGADPVRGYCPGPDSMVLLGDESATGSLLVDPSANTRKLDGRVSFDLNCDAVVVGGSLSVIPQFDGPAVELRAPLIADATAVSPRGEQVVIVTAGFPVEVLSTLPADELPHPWDSTTGSSGVVTALGERELFADKDLVIADATGVLSRTPIPDLTELAAARPDGTGALLVELGSNRILLVDEHKAVPASNACGVGTLSYRPGVDFMRSYDAAEAQIPVADNGSTWTDCRDGRPLTPDRATQIVSYDIGQRIGRIVARVGDKVTVTTWSRGDPASLVTIEGPALTADQGGVSFDPTGQASVVHSAHGRQLSLLRRDRDGWATSLTLTTDLRDVVDAQVVDNGTLIVAMSSAGGFELFDVGSGRLVASDPGLTASYEHTTGFTSRRVGDDLVLNVRTAGGSTSAAGVIRIPVAIPALRRQLCLLYSAPECPH